MTAPTSQAARFADGLERSLWTVAEAAGASGIVAGYQSLPLPDIPPGYTFLVGILVAGVLAGIKSSIAQKWGNGTAATLPADLEPVPQPALAIPDPELPAVAHVEHFQSPAGRRVNLTPPNAGDVDGDGHDDTTGRFV